ncbi:HNH endonuclease signature motif containing protein [Georgenia sp. SYP-B2076]|uniref:HNH endonuclease n=1 Tax=Georgenia sp. SYP-B2076 TaxID=2495881 RepID=UPI000F8CC21B|nr:HNH endonuclease signature motif containing protein [Georgenia sp. SYP-B2076]
MAETTVDQQPAGDAPGCIPCLLGRCEAHGAGLPAGTGRSGRPLGLTLRELAPGADLAALLELIDISEVDDYTAVEVVAAHKRQEARSAALAAAAAAQVATRESMNPARLLPSGERKELNVAAEELAMRLGMTRAEANRTIDVGEAFTGVFAPTGEALERGEIDLRKATTIVTTLWVHPGAVAWFVQDEVLPHAGTRTHPQLVRDLNRALIAVDPDDAHHRHVAATRRRQAERMRPLPDGMASKRLYGPAEQLVALDLVAEGQAQAAKNDGDSRTLDQLRFDALIELATQALATGWIGPAPDAHVDPSAPPPARVDPAPGSTARDEPPVRARPPLRLSPDHIQIRLSVPLSVALPPADRPEPAPGEDPAATIGDTPTAEVAELDRYGPVVPSVARAFAAGGTWRRIVTDPLSGAVLDVGRTRYRPPADLVRHVRARDKTCVLPICSVPADHAELDHTIPASQGGTTADHNLGPLCKRDHQVKSFGAFTLEQPTPGTFVWTTPSGHRYRQNPDGTVTPLEPREEPPPF